MEEFNQHIVMKLQTAFGASILDAAEFRSELTVLSAKEHIVDICRFLKNDPELHYQLLADVCGIDMQTPEKRFGVIYNLYSYAYKHRLRIKVFLEEENPKIQTVTGVWSTANWHEREAYDMYGIIFEGHPDLRRLYMPEEFEYYPLRKDFPLMGIPGSLDLPLK